MSTQEPPDTQGVEDTEAEDKLTANEVQEIRLLIERAAIQARTEYEAPELTITDDDRDRFAESILSGKPYTEKFSKLKGKLTGVLRVRFKNEDDEIISQLHADFTDGVCREGVEYRNRLSIYQLSLQLINLDGVEQKPKGKETSLRDWAAASIFETMSQPKLYLLVLFLKQFELKVLQLSQEAVQSDFS